MRVFRLDPLLDESCDRMVKNDCWARKVASGFVKTNGCAPGGGAGVGAVNVFLSLKASVSAARGLCPRLKTAAADRRTCSSRGRPGHGCDGSHRLPETGRLRGALAGYISPLERGRPPNNSYQSRTRQVIG